jgi:hypothetical protein
MKEHFMDPNTVDQLARLVGSGQSRRRILKSLAGGTLGALAAAVGFDRAGAAARCRAQAVVCSTNADCCSANCLPKDRSGRRFCAECGSPAQCAAPVNASATCTGGTCGFTCDAGFTPCDGGCLDASSDPNNCGACGNLCPQPANATATCAKGTCGFTCNSGYEPDGAGGCQAVIPSVCSGLVSPSPCFPFDSSSCGVNGTCHCGTDLAGNLTCYENAYCNYVGQTQCASNADCVVQGFPSGSVCFAADNCCGAGTTGCTTPCPSPLT